MPWRGSPIFAQVQADLPVLGPPCSFLPPHLGQQVSQKEAQVPQAGPACPRLSPHILPRGPSLWPSTRDPGQVTEVSLNLCLVKTVHLKVPASWTLVQSKCYICAARLESCLTCRVDSVAAEVSKQSSGSTEGALT